VPMRPPGTHTTAELKWGDQQQRRSYGQMNEGAKGTYPWLLRRALTDECINDRVPGAKQGSARNRSPGSETSGRSCLHTVP
jgi:hypothetical protein